MTVPRYSPISPHIFGEFVKSCHPERRAKPGVEGSSYQFKPCSIGSAKILRLPSVAQDDKFVGWFFCLTSDAIRHRRATEGRPYGFA